MPKIKKIPLRMCVGCRQRKNKKELIRIVRTPEAMVVLDLTGKKSGRGAYICPQVDCLHLAIKNKGLEKALCTGISADIIDGLQDQLAKH